jgi:hypothetical protein
MTKPYKRPYNWADVELLYPGCSVLWDRDGGPTWASKYEDTRIYIGNSGNVSVHIGNIGDLGSWDFCVYDRKNQKWIIGSAQWFNLKS